MPSPKTIPTAANGNVVATLNEAGVELNLSAINPAIAHEAFRGFRQAMAQRFGGDLRPFFQDDGENLWRISILVRDDRGEEIFEAAAELIGPEIERAVNRRALRQINSENNRIKQGITIP